MEVFDSVNAKYLDVYQAAQLSIFNHNLCVEASVNIIVVMVAC